MAVTIVPLYDWKWKKHNSINNHNNINNKNRCFNWNKIKWAKRRKNDEHWKNQMRTNNILLKIILFYGIVDNEERNHLINCSIALFREVFSMYHFSTLLHSYTISISARPNETTNQIEKYRKKKSFFFSIFLFSLSWFWI